MFSEYCSNTYIISNKIITDLFQTNIKVYLKLLQSGFFPQIFIQNAINSSVSKILIFFFLKGFLYSNLYYEKNK